MAASPTANAEQLGFFVVDAIDRVRQLNVAVSFDIVTGLTLAGSVSTATATTPDGLRGLASRDDGADGLFRAPQAMARPGSGSCCRARISTCRICAIDSEARPWTRSA